MHSVVRLREGFQTWSLNVSSLKTYYRIQRGRCRFFAIFIKRLPHSLSDRCQYTQTTHSIGALQSCVDTRVSTARFPVMVVERLRVSKWNTGLGNEWVSTTLPKLKVPSISQDSIHKSFTHITRLYGVPQWSLDYVDLVLSWGVIVAQLGVVKMFDAYL